MMNDKIDIEDIQICEQCTLNRIYKCNEKNPLDCHRFITYKTEKIICPNCILIHSCSQRCLKFKNYMLSLIDSQSFQFNPF